MVPFIVIILVVKARSNFRRRFRSPIFSGTGFLDSRRSDFNLLIGTLPAQQPLSDVPGVVNLWGRIVVRLEVGRAREAEREQVGRAAAGHRGHYFGQPRVPLLDHAPDGRLEDEYQENEEAPDHVEATDDSQKDLKH